MLRCWILDFWFETNSTDQLIKPEDIFYFELPRSNENKRHEMDSLISRIKTENKLTICISKTYLSLKSFGGFCQK